MAVALEYTLDGWKFQNGSLEVTNHESARGIEEKKDQISYLLNFAHCDVVIVRFCNIDNQWIEQKYRLIKGNVKCVNSKILD
jgi:hypothetical protein